MLRFRNLDVVRRFGWAWSFGCQPSSARRPISADPACQQAPNPKTARDVGLGAALVHPCGCLLVCESVVWACSKTIGGKIGWMLFTLAAMLLQFGLLLVILRAILVTAIGYAQ